jgi:hypothetical protein
VRTVNGVEIGAGQIPGPLTKQITDAYAAFVDFDFVAQYLKRAET